QASGRCAVRVTAWTPTSASTAPVTVGELVVGVAVWESAQDIPSIAMVPVDAIAALPGFRRRIEAATGRRMLLEPVELAGMVSPWAPPGPRTATDLLRPEHEVVPFHGSDGLLDELAAWCRHSAPVSGLLLTGGAGEGKT